MQAHIRDRVIARRPPPLGPELPTRVQLCCSPHAVATISLPTNGEAHIVIDVDLAQVPAGARTELVDAIFDNPEVRRRRVRASIPLEDPELLAAFGRHCPDARTRVAGSRSLFDSGR